MVLSSSIGVGKYGQSSPTNVRDSQEYKDFQKKQNYDAGTSLLNGGLASDGAFFGNSPSNTNKNSNSGGDVLGGTYNAPQYQAPAPVDPYAEWGGQSKFNTLVDGFNKQKGVIGDTASDAARNTGRSINSSILDLIDSLRTGQTSIDNRGINNELAKQRGTSDIYGAVGRGIQSGGVTLANKNASDSSAAGAIARAYGDIGRRELSDIGNQYELENQDIGLAQSDLERQQASGTRKIEDAQDNAVTSIVSDAQNKLAALDAAMANASLPDRISIDTEKNRIRSEVLGVLGKYDAQLQKGVSGIRAQNQDQRITEATRRGSLGQAPSDTFDYNSEVPMELQGSGPFTSNLPIFNYRNREQE